MSEENFLVLAGILIVLLIVRKFKKKKAYKIWFENLSPEEQLVELKKQEINMKKDVVRAAALHKALNKKR